MMQIKRTIALFLAVLAFLVMTAALVRAELSEPETEKEPGVPVVFYGETLFRVHGKLGPFTAEDRARGIARRMVVLAKEPAVPVESIRVTPGREISSIGVSQETIMTVSDEDAAPLDRKRQDLAEAYRTKIQQVIATISYYDSPKGVFNGIIYTILASIAAIVLSLLPRKGFPRIYGAIRGWRDTHQPAPKSRAVRVLSADRVADFLIGFTRLLHVIAKVIVVYAYLSFVFGLFARTRGYAAILLSYILGPLAIIEEALLAALPNLFFIAVVVSITYYAIQFIKWIFRALENETIAVAGFYQEWARPTYQIVRFLVIALVAVAILPYIPGYHTPAFQVLSVFLAAIFSLSASSAVGNIVAGTVLTHTRAFQIGDRVKITDTEGDIVEKTLLVTRIRTNKNVDVTLPNSMVLGSYVTN